MSDNVRHSKRNAGQRRIAVNTKVTETLRVLLATAAESNNRTLSAEIEARLAESFWPVAQPDIAAVVREAVQQEMRAEFDGRRADPALVRQLDELCGPAAYQRINGNKANA